jgi:hypothetical protein
LPDLLVVAQQLLLAISLGVIVAWFARRRRPSDQELITASAAAVCAFVVFGKVLSGQYVIWLIPLVALLDGRRAVAATLALVVAMLLMQEWYPARYPGWMAGSDPAVAWIVLGRDLVLVALLAVLVVPAAWFAAVADLLGTLVTPIMGGLTARRATLRPTGGMLEPGPASVRATFVPIPEHVRKEP